jgi:hypothetical protein
VNEDRAREAIEHFQTAALEMIAALRAALDIVEDLVKDPHSAAGAFGGMAEAARRDPRPESHRDSHRVQRIDVS